MDGVKFEFNDICNYNCIRKKILNRDGSSVGLYFNNIFKLLQNNEYRYSLYKYLISSKFEHRIAIKKLQLSYEILF